MFLSENLKRVKFEGRIYLQNALTLQLHLIWLFQSKSMFKFYQSNMTISVIGIGLIGGSLAITLKENGFADTIIGVDADTESEHKALRRKIIDEALPLEEAIKRSQLIILATPVNSMRELLPQILDQVEDQVVIDVGSTKELLLERVKGHPKRQSRGTRRSFISFHPHEDYVFGCESA